MSDININQKHEKQMQAMVYAIENYPTINRTKLMKFIFFVDLFASNMLDATGGDTILEDKYIRLVRGPVPDYGFNETSTCSNNDYFTVSRKPNGTDSEGNDLYYYSFKLNAGVSSNLSDVGFTKQEIDVLKLTLNTIIYNSAHSLSDKTHEYKLWIETENQKIIDKNKFKLNYSAKFDLNKFLHTVIYLSPINEIKSQLPKSIPTITKDMRLPVYADATTGKIINVD